MQYLNNILSKIHATIPLVDEKQTTVSRSLYRFLGFQLEFPEYK